eukprot:GHVS01100940.1.p2 GENE.GHVS01100940.1~~GHVS01100940.1.p2  ORF type:complete len:108 (-),score=13.78 GHVS01100940.1:41-364(-)
MNGNYEGKGPRNETMDGTHQEKEPYRNRSKSNAAEIPIEQTPPVSDYGTLHPSVSAVDRKLRHGYPYRTNTATMPDGRQTQQTPHGYATARHVERQGADEKERRRTF